MRNRPGLLCVFWLLVNVLLVSISLTGNIRVLRDLVSWIWNCVSWLSWVRHLAIHVLLLIVSLRGINILLIIIDTLPLGLIKRLLIVNRLILIIHRVKLLILGLLNNITWNIISVQLVGIRLFLLVVHLVVWKIVYKERKNFIGYYKNKKYLVYY